MTHRILAAILAVLAITCFIIWRFADGDLRDFGLNAFTEVSGIIATVFIVDYLIKRKDEHRLLPQKARAYEDVRILTSRVVSFWTDIRESCVPGPWPSTLDELFSNDSFTAILHNLDMDSASNVIPKRTWWTYFPQNIKEFKNHAERLLERHNQILEPKTYASVHILATEVMDPSLIATINSIDAKISFPRPRVLGSYYIVSDEYRNAIIDLVRWCQKMREFLENNGFDNLRQVISEPKKWDPKDPPPCMISPEKIKIQFSDMELYRAQGNRLDI